MNASGATEAIQVVEDREQVGVVDEHEPGGADEALDPGRAAFGLLARRERAGHRGGRVGLARVVEQPGGAAGEDAGEPVAGRDAVQRLAERAGERLVLAAARARW